MSYIFKIIANLYYKVHRQNPLIQAFHLYILLKNAIFISEHEYKDVYCYFIDRQYPFISGSKRSYYVSG